MVQTNYNINYDMRTSKSMKLKKKLGERLRKHQSAYRFSLMSPLKRIATVLIQLLEGKPNRSQSRMGGN